MDSKEIKDIFKNLFLLKNIRTAETKPKLEGISFRYKTVQFHLVDDTFEEIERNSDVFGDTKIYSERFSLPGYGVKNEDLTGDEFQYELIIGINSKVNQELYFSKLEQVINTIEDKHGINILMEMYSHDDPESGEPTEGEDVYNMHKLTFYTSESGIFPEE